jgi:hypothetical protein
MHHVIIGNGITGPSASYVPECSGLPGGAICITVPAYSCGYFVAPIYTAPRQGGIDKTYRFDVNPNPSTGMISIKPNYLVENMQECWVTVFNQNGELLLTNNLNEQGIIDLSYLPNGLYYVKIMDPIIGVINTEKLIVIR